MRILHVISSVDSKAGGPAEGLRQRGAFLQAHGHQVEVLCLDAPDVSHLASYPLPVHAMGPSTRKYAWAPGFKTWLEQHAASFDAVVISGLWQYHGWATSRVMRQLGRPYFVFTHGMLDPWFRHAYPLKHLKKWIYWLLAEHQVLHHARAVLFTSEAERARARQSFSLYRVNEEVVDYGTSAAPVNGPALGLAFRQRHPALVDKHIVMFLGRVHEKKGCDLLIRAFARVSATRPDLHLLIAGPADQPTASKLQALADGVGVADRITWLGMLTGDDKWAALHASNAFMLPSHQENFGIAVAEAMACGLPVLISDKVNIWQQVVADNAGLVAPDTAAGTIHNLERWLGFSPDEQALMGRNAKRSFEARFTVEASAASLLKVIGKP